MKNTLLLVALVVVATASAATIQEFEEITPFIGGGAAVATGALHAVILLALPDAAVLNAGRLGGGSIVSTNRVLTAAHVVADAALVRAAFYITDNAALVNKRFSNSLWVQTMTGYDPETRENDLAMILFQNVFPVLNVIPVTKDAAPTTGDAFLASYGFVDEDSTTATVAPLLAPHTFLDTCAAPLVASKTHFCAGAKSPAIVCPGDNGSGLWKVVAGTTPTKALVGLVSRLAGTRCTTVAPSAFTNLGNKLVQGFLASQGIVTV